MVKEDKYGLDSKKILDAIFAEISAAYELVAPGSLTKVVFADQDEANDFIHSDDYETNKLCFTLGWSAFSNDPENPEFALKIRTDLTQSGMPDPNIPQDRFYVAKYTKESLTAFNDTNYLQVMTLATKAILDEVSGGDYSKSNFNVMYTPMDTGAYKDYGDDAVSMVMVVTANDDDDDDNSEGAHAEVDAVAHFDAYASRA